MPIVPDNIQKINRSQFQSFLDTTPASTPTRISV